MGAGLAMKVNVIAPIVLQQLDFASDLKLYFLFSAKLIE